MIEHDFDVVIVGAGNGGLTAATQLALEGVKVLLLEQHNLPGGFATSFIRGRFEFEATLHELCDFGPKDNKGSIRKLFEDDLRLNVEFVEIPEAFRLICTDEDDPIDIIVPFGPKNLVDAIGKVVPECKNSLLNYLKLSKEINEAISYLTESQGNPEKEVLLKKYKNFLKSVPYSLDEVNNALKIPKKAQQILNAYWIYIGIPTSRVNFTFYSAMHYYFLTRKAYFPKYRSHDFSTAMELKIREYSGKILYNTRVERILVENGNVIGVITSKGDKIGTNHIISNASPTILFNDLFLHIEVPAG